MIYFLSILDSEYIKIGFTEQVIDKRKAALQTGNPYKIDVLFTIEGTLKQEKEIHKGLNDVFGRLKVFSNPVNEWYPGNNPVIKMVICNVRNQGIEYAIDNLNGIHSWDSPVEENEVFSVRALEKALRRSGLSISQAKHIISINKAEIMSLWPDLINGGHAPEYSVRRKNPNIILRKANRDNQVQSQSEQEAGR